MRDLLLSSGLHVFLLSQRLHVLNGHVCVVYSECEYNAHTSTLTCMTYEYLTNSVHVEIKTWLVS